MLTKAKEHVLGKDREALHISPYMHGNMGFHISPNGSVQHLSVEILNVDKNRNNAGVSSKLLGCSQTQKVLKFHWSCVYSFLVGIRRGRIFSWRSIALVQMVSKETGSFLLALTSLRYKRRELGQRTAILSCGQLFPPCNSRHS
jgi:hypothetical protein